MKRVTKTQLSFFFSLALGLSACGQNPGELECGNGTLEDVEQCDDGNTVAGDGCSQDCEIEDECGDADLDANEECDDGNTIAGDGCNASCESEGSPDAEEINDYIRGLNPVPTEPPSEVVNAESLPEVSQDGNYSCSTKNLTKTVPLTEVSILSGVTSGLFPGAILHGDSLSEGQFSLSGIDQRPMKYSLSILDGTAAPRSAVMQNPSLSEFRDTFGVILSQAALEDVPVSATASIQEIRSEQDIDLALGVDVNTLTTDVKTAFDFFNQETRSRFLVTIDMAFFTANLDSNLKPSDFFANTVTLEEVQEEFTDEVPPVYVSSITYGTRYYVAVESIFSEEEISAALDVAFDKGTNSVDGQVTLSTSDVLQNISMTAIAVGAQPDKLAAFNAILSGENRLEGVKDFMTQSANFSAANIGAALSFTMTSMIDNSIAALAFSDTTDVLTCERISQNIQVTLKKISLENGSDFGNNDLEIYGLISAQSLNSQILFDRDDNNFVVVPNNGSKTFPGAQFQRTVRIDPRIPTANITLVADLFEDDGNSGDDDLPFTSFQINKDSTGSTGESTKLLGEGFSAGYGMLVSSTDGDLTVTVELRPIP
jgi:thiol-activated cytolysin